MFDFRYHALSLVAVFVALTIGILLGVAIGEQGLIETADRKLRDSLREDIRRERAESAAQRVQLAQQLRAQAQLYPLLVENRLAGERIGLVGLGGLPDETIRAVRAALEGTGGRLSAVTVIREPVPPEVLPGAGAGEPLADRQRLREFGTDVGRALVRGGPLLSRVQRSLLQSSSGRLGDVTAVVVFRAARDEAPPEAVGTRAFELGLVAGLGVDGTPVVGVETTTTEPSQIRWYSDRRLSSVDNVDEITGQAALVFALAGARGTYGVKDTAQALVPTAAGRPLP